MPSISMSDTILQESKWLLFLDSMFSTDMKLSYYIGSIASCDAKNSDSLVNFSRCN